MNTILIAGGTGNIGQYLVPMLLEKSYRVIIWTRDGKHSSDHANCSYEVWNPNEFNYGRFAIREADCIINLAGAGIADKRWTEKRKQVVYDSRLNADITIVKGLSEVDNKVSTVINASAIGFYGEDQKTDTPFTEDDPPGEGFLSAVCEDWEKMIRHVTELGKRLVILRTGIVLDKTSGMYSELSKPLKLRVGTIFSDGSQMVSWVHIRDLCNAYIHAIENAGMSGVYNVSAPWPVSNREIVTEMGKQKFGNGYLRFTVPSFLLKTVLGEMSNALTESVTVSSDKLLSTGFEFAFPKIEMAVADLESSG